MALSRKRFNVERKCKNIFTCNVMSVVDECRTWKGRVTYYGGKISVQNRIRHRNHIGGMGSLQNNSQDEPVRITDLGVRIFDVAENPKNGDALAAPRRDARTTRRRLRRRRHRLERIKFLLQENGLIEMDYFMERYYKGNLPDVYQLRYEGLDRKLKDEELAQVLIHIAKHRGFRSTRKAETKEKRAEQY